MMHQSTGRPAPGFLASLMRKPLGRMGLWLVAVQLCGCAPKQVKAPAPPQDPPPAATTPNKRYSDEDAAQELGFGTAPAQRIRSRRRSVQHKSMPLHGAQTQPCAFENCDISDEDDPL